MIRETGRRILMSTCYFCHNAVDVDDKIFRKDDCPHCGQDLHCCFQCRFYEKGRQNDCKESRAERVVDKDRANFCDYFEFGSSIVEKPEEGDVKQKLEDLFKI